MPGKMWYDSSTVNSSLSQNRANLMNFSSYVLLAFYYCLWYKKTCWENTLVPKFPWRKPLFSSKQTFYLKDFYQDLCYDRGGTFKRLFLKARPILYPLKSTAMLQFRAEQSEHKGYRSLLPVITFLMGNAPGERPKITHTNHRANTGGKTPPGAQAWVQTPGSAGWAHRPSEACGRDGGPDSLRWGSVCEAEEMHGGQTHMCDLVLAFVLILLVLSFLLHVILHSCIIDISLTFLCGGYRAKSLKLHYIILFYSTHCVKTPLK